jgi:uncharacterized protein YciI
MILAALLVSLLSQAAPPAPPRVEMTTYQMVLLRAGPSRTAEPGEGQRIQDAHLAYLAKLNRDGFNVLYGSFLDEGDLRGIVVLDVPSAERAHELMAADPHVQAGHRVVEVKPWLGPRGWFHPPAEPAALEQLVFGFLMRGTRTSQSREEAMEIQKEHLAYMDGLHKQGKLIMAGPFLDDSEWRGVVVYRVASAEEARALAAGDPAVKAGRLVIDARPWATWRGILR